jgi:predicted RNase H-like nuclease (RuvC/YqgF family)
LLQTQQLEEQKDSEMDKDKKIKQLEELVKELQEENDMLWDYLDEVRESEKALMKEIQIAVDDYVTKQMKPIGDA